MPWRRDVQLFGAQRGQGLRVRYSPSGNMVVPMLDAERRIHGLQVIYAEKRADGTRISGRPAWPRKGAFPDRKSRSRPAPCRGYATAASLHETTGLPVAVAFDAGNLMPVAQALHKIQAGQNPGLRRR